MDAPFFFLGIFLWLIPFLCYGDTTTFQFSNDGASHFFAPSANDQSLIYLGEIFGSIPPVLGGTGTTLLGELFRVFNTVALSVCFVAMQFINFAFLNIMGLISSGTELSGIEMILHLSAYVGLVVATVNKSFNLIKVHPRI